MELIYLAVSNIKVLGMHEGFIALATASVIYVVISILHNNKQRVILTA